jgi:hypothetical protein
MIFRIFHCFSESKETLKNANLLKYINFLADMSNKGRRNNYGVSSQGFSEFHGSKYNSQFLNITTIITYRKIVETIKRYHSNFTYFLKNIHLLRLSLQVYGED